MDLDAIDYFIKVADARSLSNAAKLHRLPKSTLSHKIRQLEDRLGIALFVREGRDMFLTDAGTEFLDHAHRIQATCDGAESAIAAMRQEVAGTLTIGSTGEFGTSFTSELLFAFRQRFPQVKIDVIFLSSGYLFAPERQQAFDGIFFWGEPSNVDYIARRLTGASFGLYASPAYLEKHGTPLNPAELHDHRGIAFRTPTGQQSWHLKNGEETLDVLPPASCVANDYWMIKYFAVAGEGLAYLPDFFTEIECATGHLTPVMPAWRSPEVSVNLLYPRRRYVSRKFAAFQSFCIDFYKQRADHYVPRYCVEVVSTPPRKPPVRGELSTMPKTWFESAPQLIDVAMGRTPADTVIRNGRWVNVHSGEIIANTDIAIIAGRFAYVGPDAAHAIGPKTKVIEANGRYLVPGLCDGHMHVESGMVTVTEFARAVIPHGTTTMFIDPHEIANVLGLPGVKLMHDEAAGLPINVLVQMPSCVPSAPGLENAGASLGVADVKEAMAWPNIIGLGEMMNFPGVTFKDEKMLGEIAATQAAHKTVGGHYASPDLGLPFHGYVAGGPADDHEGTRIDDAIARVRQGMRAMLRLGSAWYDVAAQIKAVTERGIDPRNFILCTDDSHSGTLVHEGHMNRVVRHAIAQGLKPITAIQMATLNTAQHFGLERELGSITPGRRADLILTSDLTALPIEMVIAHGQVLAEGGKLIADIPAYAYPESARNTVKMGRKLAAGDFDIAAPAGANQVKARVIGVIENQAPTRALECPLKVSQGLVEMDPAQDVCQIALVERHRATGQVTNAFVSGFGYNTDCAVASTVAHDSHHMIVVGTSKTDMALAANTLGEVGGGIIVVSKGKVLALVELPIAGLMSDERAEVVAEKAGKMVEAMAKCGCTLNNAYMQHSLLALVVIPELRISDIGLIDVTRFARTELFA